MALTVFNPPAGSVIGPGVGIQVVTSLIGAVAFDDYFQAQVHDTAHLQLNYRIYGDTIAHGSHTGGITLGVTEQFPGATTGRWEQNFPVGSACEIVATLVHANGVVVDGPTTIAGFVWDPTAALYVLVDRIRAVTFGVEELLDAVRIIKTTPGQV